MRPVENADPAPEASPNQSLAPAAEGSFAATAKAPARASAADPAAPEAPKGPETSKQAKALYPEGGDTSGKDAKADAGEGDGEGKPDEGAKPDEAKPDAKPDEKPAEDAKPNPEEVPAAPEGYKIELPEGVDVAPEVLTKFQTFAAEAKLTQGQAQAAANMHLELVNQTMKAAGEQFLNSQRAAWSTTIDGWKDAIAKDPEIGGEKSKAVQQVLGVALDEYGSPEARQAFDLTGAGWNPAILKMFYKMANALSEGRPRQVGNPTGQRGRAVTPAQRFYPSDAA